MERVNSELELEGTSGVTHHLSGFVETEVEEGRGGVLRTPGCRGGNTA